MMLFTKDILLNKLPEDISLKLIKDAFAMYFDQSKSFNDSSMVLAKYVIIHFVFCNSFALNSK